MKNNNKWENYGDKNPLHHGGIWIKKDIESCPNCFYIIKFEPEIMEIYDLYVDISDSWIDKKAIENYADVAISNEHYAINCIEYYNYLEFGTAKKFNSNDEVIDELESYGIKI
jgi:hypothetical protein